jgi:cation-transporting P-type ATPase 13A2
LTQSDRKSFEKQISRTELATPVILEKQRIGLGEPIQLPWFTKGETEVALTGKAFSLIYSLREEEPTLFNSVVLKTQVYARMSPDEKMILISSLQALGQTVGMCGEGANDCEALKAADVGVSLGAAEASIAAPFTSKT